MDKQTRNQSQTRGDGFPLDNLTYDLLTILHEKSKGLEAYEKYLEDAEANEEVVQVLEELKEQDIQAVNRLRECLTQVFSGEEQESTEEEAGAGARSQGQSESKRSSKRS
jgi:hypothetical protein